MSAWSRPGLQRLNEFTEQRLGISVMPVSERERFGLMEREYGEYRSNAEELGWQTMDLFGAGARPQELSQERRRSIAQKSRVAFKFDPNAGAEAQLLADFAFGRGVNKPVARDKKVQEVIDAGWEDPKNEEVLFGFLAQRRLSNELITAGELFPTFHASNGHVRFGRLDPDTVKAVIPDPEDRLRPIYAMTEPRKFLWDYEKDQAVATPDEMKEGRPRVVYWPHWRNLEDAEREREDEDPLVLGQEEPLPVIAPEKLAGGGRKDSRCGFFHVGLNQTGEELRGNPPWARSLRFMGAMITLTEAHITMAQAASQFIAKRSMVGTPSAVQRAAAAVTGHVSELGASRLRGGQETGGTFAPGANAPFAAGSIWNENQSSKLESMNLNSGAGQMRDSAQIVRAPLAAASGFGQHYYGDAGGMDLATAATMELPATMRVQSWQQYAAVIYRWGTDRIIEEAVRAGRLGNKKTDENGRPFDRKLSELRLSEADDQAEMEQRTGVDLSYSFEMPFPGRRQLADVATFVVAARQAFDPNGVNIPFTREIGKMVLEAMGADDIGHKIEQMFPDGGIPGGIGPQKPVDQTDPETGLINPNASQGAGGGGAASGGGSGDGEGVKNAKRTSTPPGESRVTEAWVPPNLRQALDELEAELAGSFEDLVAGPALAATMAAR